MLVRGLVLGLAALLCSACSVMKDSKDMKKMLGELNRKGDELSKRISDVETEATFDRSYKSFQEETEKLFGENGKGDVSESDMVHHAQAAIQSLLFQFWKGDYHDTVDALDNRYSLHVDIFFSRLNGKIEAFTGCDLIVIDASIPGCNPDRFAVDRLAPNRNYKGVAALGAFMMSMRPEYEAALKKANLPRLSLYDVVINALKSRNANGPQPLLPKAYSKVLEWKQEAVHVLQLRHNFLPVMVLGRLTDLKDQSNPEKLLQALVGKKVDLNGGGSESRKVDDRQLILWTSWLNQAIETRRELRAMGFEVEYNKSFGMMAKALNFNQAAILSGGVTASSSRRAQLEYAFADAWIKATSEMGTRLPKMPDTSGFLDRLRR